MEFKGTKGKWHLNLNGGSVNDSYNSCVIDENDNSICNVFYTHDENLANALLISKAPEMLETINELLKELRYHGFNNSTAIYNAERLIKEATEIN